MYRRHGDKLVLVFLACDLLVTTAVWLGAYYLRFSLWPSRYGVPDLAVVLQSLPGVLLLAAVSYRLCGLYEVHRLRQLPRELGVVCRASAILLLLAVAAAFYRRDVYESRLALTLFFVINAAAADDRAANHLAGAEVSPRAGLELWPGRDHRLGPHRPHGRPGDPEQQLDWPGGRRLRGRRAGAPGCTLLPRLGGIDHLQQVVTRHDVDHVFVALPMSRYGELPGLYKALSDVLVDVQLVPEVPHVAGMRLRMVDIDNLHIPGTAAEPAIRLATAWPSGPTDIVLGTRRC